ncbi:hypothetical protein LV564_05155 [Komagataeibacter nataicola]|uniref:hypothetical protein n=1 Tax=Komagataeibacter nataicola TaxID=265960 RepID=UPI0023DD32D6|nr:hypothetical protein [Komagataeibacter nataicola]WEQ56476.1 hypothetical protein LV564_05155 [Komagataeibacter nataicola]
MNETMEALHRAKRKFPTLATYKARWKKKARALTQAQRQQALDMLRAGETCEQVQHALKIDRTTILGIIEPCTVRTVITSLKEVAP